MLSGYYHINSGRGGWQEDVKTMQETFPRHVKPNVGHVLRVAEFNSRQTSTVLVLLRLVCMAGLGHMQGYHPTK